MCSKRRRGNTGAATASAGSSGSLSGVGGDSGSRRAGNSANNATHGAAGANGSQDRGLGDAGAMGKDGTIYEDSIAAELAEQIERVHNGTFPKVANAQEALLREMEKKVAIADRYRKLQIKNINELYESEIVELKARFEVCCVAQWRCYVFDVPRIDGVLLLPVTVVLLQYAESFQ
jgi:hypothetical protein